MTPLAEPVTRRDGRPQRHAGLVLRRRSLHRSRRRGGARAWPCTPRARTSSTSAASRPARAPIGSTPTPRCARVVPVIRELAAAGVPISIDTTRAAVAAAALEAGAALVNDVSGGLADPDMARVVADAGCPWVLMHWRGHSGRWRDLAHYHDVVAEVCAELRERAEDALAAGVAPDKIIVDPGLGFAKTAEHNWQLAAHLDAVHRARVTRCCSREPQVVPRPAAGRAGRHAPAGGRARGGDAGHHRARGGRRRLGRPRARRRGRRSTRSRSGARPRRVAGPVTRSDHADRPARAATTACTTSSAPRGRTSSSTSTLELDLAPAAAMRRRRRHRALRRAGRPAGRDRRRASRST